MERALRDGLNGIPPGPAEDATVALGGTASTRMLGGDSIDATRAMPPQPRTRSQLQPLPDEPPTYGRGVPGPPTGAVPQARRPARRRSIAPLVALLVIVAALVGGWLYLQSATGGPQLREFNGGLQQTVDDLRGAIRDNTR
jgi:hypothetical protein